MIKLVDLAKVMNETNVTLFVNERMQEDVRYGEDLSEFGKCVVTKIEYLNCDVIAIYATDNRNDSK